MPRPKIDPKPMPQPPPKKNPEPQPGGPASTVKERFDAKKGGRICKASGGRVKGSFSPY
jgi:hypothetical protein